MLMHSRNPLAAGRQARPPHSHVQCVHSSLWKAPASRCCVAYATSPVSQATTAESSQVDGLGHLDGAIADGNPSVAPAAAPPASRLFKAAAASSKRGRRPGSRQQRNGDQADSTAGRVPQAQQGASPAELDRTHTGSHASTSSPSQPAPASSSSRPKLFHASEQGAGHSSSSTQSNAPHGVVRVASATEAGTAAAHLAGLLRAGRGAHATVRFTDGRGVMKAMRILAIANEFLNQHQSALSFTPRTFKRILPSALGDGNFLVEDEQFDGHNRAPARNTALQLFVVEAWSRPAQRREIRYQKPGWRWQGSAPDLPPLFEFALDARRNWKNKAELGSDVAFNIADMLYGQLVLGQQLQAPVQQQWRQQQQRPMDRTSPASSSSSAARRHRRDDSEHVPPGWTGPLLLSVDAAQAATMFMAIMALQQRLDREEGERQVVCTLYNNKHAPGIRMDSRPGFVFKVMTRPANAAPRSRQGTRAQGVGETGKARGKGPREDRGQEGGQQEQEQ